MKGKTWGVALLLLSGTTELNFLHPLYAGGSERKLYQANGMPVIEASKDGIPFQLILKNICHPASSGACARIRVLYGSADIQARYDAAVKDAIELWRKAASTLDADFEISGRAITTSFQLPYLTSGSPAVRMQDAFQQDILQDDFVLAFPAAGQSVEGITFADSDVVIRKQYAVPDPTTKKAELKWMGAYFNPAQDGNYNPKNLVAEQLGRMLGLETSAVEGSILYPLRDLTADIKGLGYDDVYWASSLYPRSNFLASVGSLSGQIVNGQDGSGWVGAHVSLISKSSKDLFLRATNNRSLSLMGAMSLENGEFKIPAVPVTNGGEFYVLVETFPNSPLSFGMFDDFTKIFANPLRFETEFYDGKDRESNLEAVLSTANSIIKYAATVKVVPGVETTNVIVISNQADAKLALRKAPGSTNETLSSELPPPAKTSFDTLADNVPSPKSGGCGLIRASDPIASDEDSGLSAFAWIGMLILGVVVCLAIREQLDPKEE